MPPVRGVMERAFSSALRNAKVSKADAATVSLARRYAQMLDVLRGEEDEPRELAKLGANYLAALKELGMTPLARKVTGDQGKTEAPASKLQQAIKERDELGIRRANRKTS